MHKLKSMKIKIVISTALAFIAPSFFSDAHSQAYRFKIVNMIPIDSSNETRHDGEPNIAVNPRNPAIIAASAFTFYRGDLCGCGTNNITPDCRAPIYFSNDTGNSWALKPVLPSNNGVTHDISLTFGGSGSLYAAILKGCQDRNSVNKGFMVVRIDSPSSRNEFRILDRRFGEKYDQPWIVSTSSINGLNRPQNDRLLIGVNKNGESLSERIGSRMGNGKTAQVMMKYSSDNFDTVTIEKIGTAQRNMSGVRVAVHDSGQVYAIFYRWLSGGRVITDSEGTSSPVCDIVVVRDDSFALRTSKFQGLGAGAGNVIASNRFVPISYPGSGIVRGRLGNARLVGSNLSIAVDPINPMHVYVAWCDSLPRSGYTLHCLTSTNGGNSWERIHEHLENISNVMNPAIAITTNGVFGIVYQQLTREAMWETHFRLYAIHERQPVPMSRDYILSSFPDTMLPELNSVSILQMPTMGDYIDLVAVDSSFYGVFCTINTPDPRAFPTERPIYHRVHNFETGQLLDRERTRIISPSVDPFFFKVQPRRQ